MQLYWFLSQIHVNKYQVYTVASTPGRLGFVMRKLKIFLGQCLKGDRDAGKFRNWNMKKENNFTYFLFSSEQNSTCI